MLYRTQYTATAIYPEGLCYPLPGLFCTLQGAKRKAESMGHKSARIRLKPIGSGLGIDYPTMQDRKVNK